MKKPKKVGRPRIVQTPEEFDALVEEYEALCQENECPVTFTGMAIHLGFASRRSFYDYEKTEGFSHSVKRARLLVEAEYESRLHGPNVAGAIFALKNHGWSDKPQHNVEEDREWVIVMPEKLTTEEWMKEYGPEASRV